MQEKGIRLSRRSLLISGLVAAGAAIGIVEINKGQKGQRKNQLAQNINNDVDVTANTGENEIAPIPTSTPTE